MDYDVAVPSCSLQLCGVSGTISRVGEWVVDCCIRTKIGQRFSPPQKMAMSYLGNGKETPMECHGDTDGMSLS